MSSSKKLMSKFQATIPKNIRKALQLTSGDTLVKAKPFDEEYLKAIQHTLTEWESTYDKKAFNHLQDLYEK